MLSKTLRSSKRQLFQISSDIAQYQSGCCQSLIRGTFAPVQCQHERLLRFCASTETTRPARDRSVIVASPRTGGHCFACIQVPTAKSSFEAQHPAPCNLLSLTSPDTDGNWPVFRVSAVVVSPVLTVRCRDMPTLTWLDRSRSHTDNTLSTATKGYRRGRSNSSRSTPQALSRTKGGLVLSSMYRYQSLKIRNARASTMTVAQRMSSKYKLVLPGHTGRAQC